MIILNKPYVSDCLVETIKKNGFDVLDNEVARNYFSQNELVSTSAAVEKYNSGDFSFYTNSENSIDWIAKNLSGSKLAEMIKISKDKALFRKKLQSIYPNYYFKKVLLDDLETLDCTEIKFPVILKPAVGFLSFGVYPIKSELEWKSVLQKLKTDLEKLEGIFPKSVVDMQKFIIEEMIFGDEFALDAYFDENGKATILNIFQHPFFDDNDVSDRAYFTSKAILEKYLDKFTLELDKIGSALGFKNFPFHLELRANSENIIPIEINPLRFCGWCITDIAQSTWGINIYEYYLNKKKPNWNEILKTKGNEIYYFTIGDIPSSINNCEIKSLDYDAYLKNISNPLVVRKIDYLNNPVFAIVFAKTDDINEIKNILKLDMNKFINV